ncbi:MAG: dTDP-4-dehydrorhamnose 3,5-epimerase family protein [Vulcanimicrobiaceae bacterium]|jgi:dTDP-4-dehydrorhamnose 3,5-epimerase
MTFEPLSIAGAFLIRSESLVDERGSFARLVCAEEFARAGLEAAFVQQSIARNHLRGTLRGLHLQLPPHAEAKYIRCIAGAMFDAVVDLRPTSPSYLQTAAVTIDADRGDAVFIPAGCAHGYQTLCDGTDVLYAMTTPYDPSSARVILWSDPRLAIAWPLEAPTLSPRDAAAPTLDAFLARERDALVQR